MCNQSNRKNNIQYIYSPTIKSHCYKDFAKDYMKFINM